MGKGVPGRENGVCAEAWWWEQGGPFRNGAARVVGSSNRKAGSPSQTPVHYTLRFWGAQHPTVRSNMYDTTLF